jgi:hypothetical protein
VGGAGWGEAVGKGAEVGKGDGSRDVGAVGSKDGIRDDGSRDETTELTGWYAGPVDGSG